MPSFSFNRYLEHYSALLPFGINSGYICLNQQNYNFRSNGEVSKLESFSLGFVQGSGLGPTLFLVLAQDLNTLSRNTELIKFADDSTLLVPENTDVSVATEFCHQDWAKGNSMIIIINLAKSKEIVFFYDPRAIPISIPSPIFGIE